MGKRTSEDGHVYWQCDVTGFPMQARNCYRPTWNKDGKLVKTGSFCNWETLLAFARRKYPDEFAKIKAYVSNLLGTTDLQEPPPIEQLVHFGGCLMASDYHAKCCEYSESTLKCVCILLAEQECIEVHVNLGEIVSDMEIITDRKRPFKRDHKIQLLNIKNDNHYKINQLACKLFNGSFYGHVFVTEVVQEASFLPRTRYVPLSLDTFKECFFKNKKRRLQDTSSVSMTTKKYNEEKAAIEARFKEFEQQASKNAFLPQEVNSRSMKSL